MARINAAPGLPRLITLAAVAVVVLALYLGKAVLMPLALGILFSFLLAPLVTRVERTGLGRIPAVIIVTVLTFAVVGAASYFVVGQLMDLVEALPKYQANIRQRVETLRSRPSPFTRVTESIQVITKELTTSQPTTATAPASAPAAVPEPDEPLTPPQPAPPPSPPPMPVTVVEPVPSPLAQVRDTLGWLLGPLGQAAIVVVFVIFILVQLEDLRDRIIYLLGRGRIHLTTQAMDDASRRISRYLLMQLIINVTYGVPVAVGLYFLGVPNALVWGLLATLLRYLPYVGPWLAASMPVALSLAVFSDWWHPLAVIGLFVLLELLSNNVMEPWLYGTSTGLSSVAVIVSAVFWTWLWGPIGLLLATPLTVCLVVLGKYVPQLEFLNVLLGDEPVWDVSNRFYQRLLAMDDEEAGDIVEEYLEEESLVGVYDNIVLPAMHLAEYDRHRGVLSPDREEFIFQAITGLVEDLEDADVVVEKAANGEDEDDESAVSAGKTNGQSILAKVMGTPPPAAAPEPPKNPPHVLCLPARDEADELAARIFAQVLRKAGFPATAASVESLASEMLDLVERSNAPIVCISALPPAATAHSRYLCKRLRTRFEKIKLVVGLWNAKGDLTRARARLTCLGTDKIVRSIKEALHEIRQFNVPLTPEPSPVS